MKKLLALLLALCACSGERTAPTDADSSESTGATETLQADGLFVSIGLLPQNAPFAALAALDDAGYFASDERCLTHTPGVFVAGDCRAKSVRQLTTAVADGASAALAALRYLRLAESHA